MVKGSRYALGRRRNTAGISYLELNLTDVQERHPDYDALVGPGIFFALSDNKALMAHGGKHIHHGASLGYRKTGRVHS
jgi:hypothetical protein